MSSQGKLMRFTRLMSIKSKIMVSLIAVSLLAILGVTAVGLSVSRGIIIDNADQMASNLVTQVALNLDERVKTLEDTTYAIMQRAELRNALSQTGIATEFERRQAGQALSDAINQSPQLLNYTRFALVIRENGEAFQYARYRSDTPAQAEVVAVEIRLTVSKQAPLRWLRTEDGELVFARLIVDEKTFNIKGLALFWLNDSFLQFLKDQPILTEKNLIIANHQGEVLYSGQYDLQQPSIRAMMDEDARQFDYDGQRTLVAHEVTARKGWEIWSLIRAADLYTKDRVVILLNLGIALAALALSVLLTVVIARTIMRNITRMEGAMTRVEGGDFRARMKPASYDEIGKLGLRFNYMVTQMEGLIDEVALGRTEKQKAEFEALQAQVNPHFLYNTLGSMKWLANKKGDAEFEEMTEALIQLLRGSIKKSGSMQTVGEEIEYIKSYVKLQKMRYGEAFTVRYELDAGTMDALIPGFLLQPLVENAIFHGIDIGAGTGVLVIRARANGDQLTLQVQDNGVGLTGERIEEILNTPKQYKGFNSLGVRQVRDRLVNYYADLCEFDMDSKPDVGTTITIRVPLTRGEEEQM